MKTLCSFLCLAISFHAWGGEQLNEGVSPSGKIHFSVRDKSNRNKDIVLWPEGNKGKSVTLCETEGWGNLKISFSPDDYWIVVQDGGASLGVHLSLYRRLKGVAYKEIEEDLAEKAETLAARQNEWPDIYYIDHLYGKEVSWTQDSRFVLIEISGSGSHEGRYYSIAGWWGLYDVGAGKFVSDLKKVNDGSVVTGPISDLKPE